MRNKSWSKRVITGLLALAMVLGLMPTGILRSSAAADEALQSALDEAKAYIDYITINSTSNDPETVVKNFGTHFTWDNEKREDSKSYLFDWSYYNGVVFEGIDYVYDVTGEKVYSDYLIEYMSSLIAADGTWAKTANDSAKEAAGYNSTHGADCYKTASLLLDAYKLTQDERYLTMAATLYADLDTAAEKYLLENAGDNYRHTWASDSSPDLWLDGLYMILPFRAEYAAYTNDQAELDLIVDRMQWVSDNMYNAEKGLFYHAADSATSNSGTYWLRSIGWYAAAIVDIMDSMEGENLQTMKAQLVKLVDGMKACQNTTNGMWLNNMAAAESDSNPYETSGTALVCYAVMKAVNEGWLDESYAAMAVLAFEGICTEKLTNNNLTDICFKGAPGSSNSTFYDNEGKGLGPFIMLYAEVLEYYEATMVPQEVFHAPDRSAWVSAYATGGSIVESTDTERVKTAVAEVLENYRAFSIELEGLADGDVATVTLPLNDGVTYPAIYHLTDDGQLERITSFQVSPDGKTVTFAAKSFSDYIAGQSRAIEPISGTGNLVGGKVYTLDTNGVDTKKTYLIVNTNNDTGYALTNNGNQTPGRTQVTISDGKIIVEDDTDIAWVFSGSTSGTVGNNGRYINPNYTTSGGGGVGGGTGTGSISLNTTGTNLTISNQNNGAYRIYRYSNNHYYYLRYNNNSWTGGRTERQNGVGSVYLYELTSSSSGEEVIFTVTPGSATLQPNGTTMLTGTVTVAGETVDLSDCTITWATSNEDIATVSNGTVTAVADGNANITATLSAVNGTALQKNIELTIPVTVQTKKITDVELSGYVGTVYVGSDTAARTGAKLTITYDDESTETVNVTLGMLTKDGVAVEANEVSVITGLTVTYGDNENGEPRVIASDFILNVIQKPDMNYPEYPTPGSVSMNKYIADYSQFQTLGVAEVNLTASGLPYIGGVDVLLVADISNSMAWKAGEKNVAPDPDAGETTKWEDLQNAAGNLVDILIGDEDATNTVSFVTFGGFDAERNNSSYSGYFDSVRTLFTSVSDAKTAKDGIDSLDIRGTDTPGYTVTENGIAVGAAQGGTNYDFAFLEAAAAIRQIKKDYADNNAGEEYEKSGREIYVIFLTDGAPDHYNQLYYKTRSNSQFDYHALYNNSTDTLGAYFSGTVVPPTYATFTQPVTNGYYLPDDDLSNEDWTEWILSDSLYAAEAVLSIEGVSAITSIGFDLDNGAFSNFSFDGADLESVLKNLAGENSCECLTTDDPAVLQSYFADMANRLAEAATNAYYMDQLGDAFSLQMAATIEKDGKIERLNPTPQITVSTYRIYGEDDIGKEIDGVTVTADMLGHRYGSPTVVEIIVFNEEGTQAYSKQNNNVGENILSEDGVIYAQNFWYNTSGTTVRIDTDGDGEVDFDLLPETFRWNIGTISDTEYVLSYYVYLDGATDGTPAPGTYKTNNFATLYYINWLGNQAQQSVDSPTMAWKSAAVYYGFYLVNNEGKPVANRATGVTGSFGDSVKVTSRILHKTMPLGSSDNVSAEFSALGILPEGYELFDKQAAFSITIGSSAEDSSWTITSNKSPKTTYVTGYSGTEATKEDMSGGGIDYTSTTVWFAVRYTPQVLDDTVVIDFGLPVDISVLVNDMFGTAGTISGVAGVDDRPKRDGEYVDGTQIFETEDDDFLPTHSAEYGDVIIVGDKIRYTPKTMNMPTYDQFAYEVLYTNVDGENEYYYGTVTVIPATTVYYEDNFAGITFSEEWEFSDDPVENATQAEDRPGNYSLSVTDANNIYGYDPAYNGCGTFSMDTAASVTVDKDTYATAEFTFTGTGFDIIAVTSNSTGVMVAQIYQKNSNGQWELYEDEAIFVDTYFGYERQNHAVVYTYTDGEWISEDKGVWDDEQHTPTPADQITAMHEAPKEGNTYTAKEIVWVTTTDAPNTLYQIPIITATDLPYGEYRVVLTATYNELFDHPNKDGEYDLYLDAIRIYDPTGVGDGRTNSVVSSAYEADGEMIPTYQELRDNIIASGSLGETYGVVFIDGIPSSTVIAEYETFGPNNELYLQPGQAILFNIREELQNSITLHIGLSSVSENVTYYIFNADEVSQPVDVQNQTPKTLETSTDMYYDVTSLIKSDGILIYNSAYSEGILSITTFKIIAEAPVAENIVGVVNETTVMNLLYALGGPNLNPDDTNNPGEDTNPGGDNNPGEDTNPGEDNPGEDTPGVDDPGDDTPGADDPGQDIPGVDNPGEDNPGEDNPGDSTTPGATDGDTNTGNTTTDGDSNGTSRTILIVAIVGGAALLMASIILLLKKLLGGR